MQLQGIELRFFIICIRVVCRSSVSINCCETTLKRPPVQHRIGGRAVPLLPLFFQPPAGALAEFGEVLTVPAEQHSLVDHPPVGLTNWAATACDIRELDDRLGVC
jgi:hypothetical protein